MKNQRYITNSIWLLSFYKVQKIIASKNEPVFYYLNNEEYTSKQEFVKEELMLISDLKKVEYSSQSILSVYFVHVFSNNNKIA